MNEIISDKTPDPSIHKDLLIALLAELSTALRARSDPEHVYTAAALGSFGAVAWGVAALQPDKYVSRPYMARPAVVAGIGASIVAIAVIAKIFREHEKFAKVKVEQARILKQLSLLPGADEIVPIDMLSPKAGNGYIWSIAVILAGAVAAIAFCLSVSI